MLTSFLKHSILNFDVGLFIQQLNYLVPFSGTLIEKKREFNNEMKHYKWYIGRNEQKQHFLENSDCQDTDARNTYRNSPIEKASTTRKFRMPSLMEEIKPVVFVKYEFENREKLKIEFFLWNFRTIRILMQGRKTMIVYLRTRLQVLCF